MNSSNVNRNKSSKSTSSVTQEGCVANIKAKGDVKAKELKIQEDKVKAKIKELVIQEEKERKCKVKEEKIKAKELKVQEEKERKIKVKEEKEEKARAKERKIQEEKERKAKAEKDKIKAKEEKVKAKDLKVQEEKERKIKAKEEEKAKAKEKKEEICAEAEVERFSALPIQSGSLYIFTSPNDEKNHAFKIGRSKTISTRETTFNTAKPSGSIYKSWPVYNVNEVEPFIHRMLNSEGFKLTKEWYACSDIKELASMINELVSSINNMHIACESIRKKLQIVISKGGKVEVT